MIRRNLIKNISFVVLTILALSFVLRFSFAEPTEPIGVHTLTVGRSERLLNTSYSPKSTPAEAGNVTELVLNATSVTKSWQGYYGNISGQLILQDAQNNTLYNWNDAEPQGKIYTSTNSSVAWGQIRCFNFTAGDPDADVGNGTYVGSDINASTENARFGLLNTDPDTINVTFNWTNHTRFNVGTVTIHEQTCPTTWTYIGNVSQAKDFTEVLLTDGSVSDGGSNALVFVTFIENDENNASDPIGFDGTPYDFQMLVMEDGHTEATEDTQTNYYFWVEIE
ncbi:MAG: hypothetical protein ABIJ21_03855 [Nanoarchaeota archaeon]